MRWCMTRTRSMHDGRWTGCGGVACGVRVAHAHCSLSLSLAPCDAWTARRTRSGETGPDANSRSRRKAPNGRAPWRVGRTHATFCRPRVMGSLASQSSDLAAFRDGIGFSFRSAIVPFSEVLLTAQQDRGRRGLDATGLGFTGRTGSPGAHIRTHGRFALTA